MTRERTGTALGREHIIRGAHRIALCGVTLDRWTVERKLPACSWCALNRMQLERDHGSKVGAAGSRKVKGWDLY